jgi:rRNA processing protein Krr1/Pno1
MKELVPRLIGPQGSTLNELEEGCGASLIVDDTGTISVYAPTQVCASALSLSLCLCLS